jgi:UDP-3-O-[3-hydroxymyristoyl] glucosamine N-acyltransferase
MLKIGIKDILSYLNKKGFVYEYIGSSSVDVMGFSALSQYKKDTITWVKTLSNWTGNELVALAVVQKGVSVPIKNQILCENSKEVFFSILENFWSESEKDGEFIGENSVIGENVVIGKNVHIGNNCSITGYVEIGDNTYISDNVVIRNNVRIGKAVYIQASSVIGEDGFAYYEDENGNKTMIKHHGGVIIGDNVFIGSHVNISRGTLEDTIIGNGVKISSSAMISHNDCIGNNVTVIGSDIYGSVEIGDNAYIVGSIVRNQSHIGINSNIGMGSVVWKNIDDNCIVQGSPAKVLWKG